MKMRKTIIFLLLFIYIFTSSIIVQGADPEPATPSGIPLSEMEERIDEMIYRTMDQVAPGIGIVVFNEGEIIFSKGYGYSDVENRTPIKPDRTVFEFGSASKISIWVAVMQLVEQGLLDLDENIEAYLPEEFVERIAFEKSFTLRDLMNHASGFGGHLFDVMLLEGHPRESITLQEALLLARPCQIFEPGTTGAYSNFGVALAALAIEYVTGKSFSMYERENILIPAGMDSSVNQPDFINRPDIMGAKATGYIMDEHGDFQESVWTYFPLYPAGGLNGTAEDFARFAMGLIPSEGEGGPFFESVDILATMFAPSSLDHDKRPGTYHGLMKWYGNVPVYGHLGLTISFTTYFVVEPEQRFGFTMNTNASSSTVLPFVVDMQELLIGVNQVPVSGDDLPCSKRVEGNFVLANRHENFLLEFLDYSILTVVDAIDENIITMNMTFMGIPASATYRQVEPYTYHLITGTPFMKLLYRELYFKMEDTVPMQIIVANGFDVTALPPGRSLPFIMGSAVFLVVNLIFFLTMPIILLGGYIWNRLKSKNSEVSSFNRISNGLILCGTLFVLNHVVFLGRINAHIWRTTSEIMPHVWINYGILGLSIVVFVGSLLTFGKGEIGKGRKVLYILSTTFMTITFALSFNWNFFTLR
jgi:CubicO group peptidase (beta-lactamase class C family)